MNTIEHAPKPRVAQSRLDAISAKHQIMSLARRVEKLTVSHKDMERFFIDRSEIVHDLRKMASAIN